MFESRKYLVAATAWALALCGGCAATGVLPTDNIVASGQSPPLTVQVAPSFRALPSLRFPIENLTDAERRIFIEAGPGRLIRRMVIVQLETVQSGSDFRFRFAANPPRRFGEHDYKFTAFYYDEAAAAIETPTKEAGHTRRFLAGHGFAPARVWKMARLARVTHPEGRSEAIIFYYENADAQFPRGLPTPQPDVPPEEAERLLQQLRNAVVVLRG